MAEQTTITGASSAAADDRAASTLVDGDFQSVAILAKSLSGGNRLRILLCISQEKRAVGSIIEELGLFQRLVSHQLKELKRTLLASIERSGPFIYHKIADPAILSIVRDLNAIAKKLLATRTTFKGIQKKESRFS
jgi:DNA-binding transcriptional ArsR family regulator